MPLPIETEAHFHDCPQCHTIWRHGRPIDSNGVGWGPEKGKKLMAEQEKATGRSKYKEEDHKCPGCGHGPVFPWARGPYSLEALAGYFFPMSGNGPGFFAYEVDHKAPKNVSR